MVSKLDDLFEVEEASSDSVQEEFDFDALMATPEEVDAASQQEEFDSIGTIGFDESVPHVAIPTEILLRRLKAYNLKRVSSRDIISRSVRLDTSVDSIEIRATDGVTYLYTRIPAKAVSFPSELVVDSEALLVGARVMGKKTFLISEGMKVYMHFRGGKIFIPTYKIDEKFFKVDPGPEETSIKIPAPVFLEMLLALDSVASSSEAPELAHIFLSKDGAVASNGVVISRYSGAFIDCALRESDLGIMKLLMKESAATDVTLTLFRNVVSVSTESFQFVFPKVSVSLSRDYLDILEVPSSGYHVNLPYLKAIGAVMALLPDISRVAEFKFSESSLDVETRTRKGDSSDFNLSRSVEGTPESGLVKISVNSLKTGVRTQEHTGTVLVTKTKNGLALVSDKVQTVIISSISS